MAQEFVFVIHFLKWKTFGPAVQSVSLTFPVLSHMASLKCEVYLDPTWRGDRYPCKPCHVIPGCVISQDLALCSPPPFPGASQSLSGLGRATDHLLETKRLTGSRQRGWYVQSLGEEHSVGCGRTYRGQCVWSIGWGMQ